MVVKFNNRSFRIEGTFGNFRVYEGNQCLAFDVMTTSDAANIAWRIAWEF